MTGGTGGTDVAARVAAVWRIESARVIGGLARVTRDVALAEDLAQDALLAALEQWPGQGVPDNPAAWLTSVARRRYVDSVRRAVTYERKLDEVGRETAESVDPVAELLDRPAIADDRLRLVFTACHPVLAPEARVALTLRMVGGLTTDEIARAFLVPVPTMAARITRAKKALGAAGVPFELPAPDELGARLGSVLEVVYLIFNEGYAASSGETWTKPVLCDEAMRLGRMLAALAPDEAEAHGLVALMELQASRLRARVGPDGAPVLLPDQDRSRWDHVLITHALGALRRAEALDRGGRYTLQAAIAACHARAARAGDTDWARIAELYGELVDLTESPIVELNRAVAVAMAGDPAEALAIVDDLVAADLAVLRDYHLVAAVRGDVLAKLGRRDESAVEFRRAASLCDNEQERAVLLARGAAPA